MNIKIGARIKDLRKRDDVTQEKLADALGVTSQAISKWESENGYPDIEYLTPIANFFNVTIDQLFDHDTAEKQKKIDEYCEQYDEMYREWKPSGERISIMRRALAEFPANEKLLVRLASALCWNWAEWNDEKFDGYSLIDGKWKHDVNKYRAHKGWEEPVNIMEELLASSVDESIRAECRDLLPRIYGAIGEKEKAVAMAAFCPDCKSRVLFGAFSGVYDDEARVYSQNLLLKSLCYLRIHLPSQTSDTVLKKQAIETLIKLFNFVFNDGNPEFYNAILEGLYIDYAELLIQENRIDEVFSALDKAYEYAKAFDVFLDKLRRNGEVKYTSPFVDSKKDISSEVYAKESVPVLLNNTLKEKNNTFYKKLSGDLRYKALIEHIEKDLAEKQ